MKLKGRVTFEDLGAGAWMLEAEDGRRYELSGVDTRRLKAGDRVEVEGHVQSGAVSTAMAGPLFHVKRWISG